MHQEGFTLEYNPESKFEAVYRGSLNVSGHNIPIKACFNNIRHITPPVIYLDETPKEFPTVTPHYFRGSNYLCYADSQLAYIDVVRLESQIMGCLQVAADLVGNLLEGKNPDKTKSEFLVYWQGGGIYFDKDNSKSDIFGIYSETGSDDFSNTDTNWLLTSTENKKYYSNFQNEIGQLYYFSIKCENSLVATEKNFPPNNLFELKEWLQESNYKAIPGLTKALTEAFEKNKNPSIALVFDAPNTKAAVIITGAAPKGLKIIKPHKLLFGKHAKKVNLFRMGLQPLDESSLIVRNAPDGLDAKNPDLSSKKILLLGCGSVGSQIAELIARHGAGRLSGELVLADFDFIKPGNIGRHSLGVESLGINKTIALKKKLEITLPKINISPIPGEMEFSSYDLIIDATGDQSFNQFLSAEQVRADIQCPIVYSWVHGAGVGVQAFIQIPGENKPCLYCINNFYKGSDYSLLKSDTENTVKNSTGSCSDWSVPYSAATAVHAAALAVNLSIEWSRGDLSPKIRSLLIQSKYGKNVKDKAVMKNKGCSYCAAFHR